MRVAYEDALYHVMSRGNERRRIFRDDADRQWRLDWLRRSVETYGWRLHAFVLMNNHEHLYVQTPRANLSAGMQFLNGSYTSYFNRRHRRAGQMFQGRYRAQVVEDEGYYLELSRYIHLNPCRARLVDRPQQWRWSSYAGYVDVRRRLPWMTYTRVLGEFGRLRGGQAAARRAYRQFVNAGLAGKLESPWAQAASGLVIGSLPFIEQIRQRLDDHGSDTASPQLKGLRWRPSLAAIVAATAKQFGTSASELRRRSRADDASRAVAAQVARVRYGYGTLEVSTALGYRSHGGVVAALQRYEASRQRLARIARRVEQDLTNG
jgi:putative transposase